MSQTLQSKDFKGRISDALRRRLFPKTNLRVPDLAYALHVSEATVWNALSANGSSSPSGRTIFKLVEFFGAPFLQEVFGGPNVYCLDPRETKKAQHIQRIAELQAELEAMG